MSEIYLCHKCGGKVQLHPDSRIYWCQCISPGCRDEPTPIEDVCNVQVQSLRQRLALYERQQRPPHDPSVLQIKRQLTNWLA